MDMRNMEGKIMRKRLTGYLIATVMIMSLTACTTASRQERGGFSSFSGLVAEKVLENSEIAQEISISDIVIDRMYWGSFSQEDANEILVLCKILNQPHVAGLDRTAGILMDANSLEMKAFREFAADEVEIGCFRTAGGQNRVLFIGTTVYQGISDQVVSLLAVQDNEWVEQRLNVREVFGDNAFCFMADERIVVASTADPAGPEDIMAILPWDPVTEQFLLSPNP